MSEEQQIQSKRILISGAGIAGLTLAYWLREFGHEPVVIEKASALRKGEYMIDFTGSGWDVAEWMGLIPKVREKSVPMTSIFFKDEHGKTTSSLPIGQLVEITGVGDRFAGLNRCDLEEMLYDKVEGRVEVRFGSSIQSLESSHNHVDVLFEDGTKEAFDLVVGADGIHSNVRNLAFGEEEDYTDHMGYYVAAFRLPGMGDRVEPGFSMRVMPGRQAGLFNVEDGDLLAYFFYVSDETSRVPQAGRRQRLMELFSGLGWQIPDLIEEIDDNTSIYYDTITMIKMPKWHTGRVALVGDAAYCLTPISGQGASMAMAGAFALADALGRYEQPEEAFEQYDRRLRLFVETLQGKAKKAAGSFIPKSRIRMWLNKWLMRAFSLLSIFGPLLRPLAKQFSIQSVFREEQKEGKAMSPLLQAKLERQTEP